MSVYDINGNPIAADSGGSSEFLDILAADGDALSVEWEQGTISASDGTNSTSTTRIRTKYAINLDSLRYLFIQCPDGWKYSIRTYSATDPLTFLSAGDFQTDNSVIRHEDGQAYKIVLATTSNTTITPSNLPSGFKVIPVYLPIWASLAQGESIGPFVTARNNPEYVDEILAVANTYWNHRSDKHDGTNAMVYGNDQTIFDVNDSETYTNHMDCSTFVGLCLRGIDYEDTSYNTLVVKPAAEYRANADYVWSRNPFDYDFPKNKTSGVYTPARRTSQLAQWLVSQRRQVFKDPKLANVEVGDIVFYSRNDSTGYPMNPHRFMLINHIALVVSKRIVLPYDTSKTYAVGECVQYNGALYECKTAISTAEAWTSSHWTQLYATWDYESLPYCHEVMESTSGWPTIQTHIIERGWEDPTYITQNNYNTLSLVCRPDLGAL